MQRIIQLFQRHADKTEFTARVAPHLEHLYRLGYRFTGSREDAEELVQELLVRIYPKRDELSAATTPRNWLARSLYHLFVDNYRRKRVGDLSLDSQPWEQSDEAQAHDRLEAGLSQLRLDELEGALTQLTDDQRALLMMHDVEGYTLSELATILETPIGTLKSRLHRIRAQLRNHLRGLEPTPRPQPTVPDRRASSRWRQIPRSPFEYIRDEV